jgi:NADH:ubiquinone oxidoreductase subunit 6 (subunit J)
MKAYKFRSSVAAVVLIVGMALLLAGCFGSGGEPVVTTASIAAYEGTLPVTTTTTTVWEEGSLLVTNEDLSTFKSKDPFIPQAVVIVTTTTTTAAVTTTTKAVTTTTKAVTTTTKAVTTTTKAVTTTTTSPYLHTMTVLSVADVGGSPAVTFIVDSLTYTNEAEGNVVSTTWGEVQVLALDVPGQVATFLHGSETVTLAVGTSIHE